MKYIIALALMLGVTLLWFAGSANWYICETQNLCEDEKSHKDKDEDKEDDYEDDEDSSSETVVDPKPITYTGPEEVLIYFTPGADSFLDNSWGVDLELMIDHLKSEPSARAEVNGYTALAGNITQAEGTALSRSRAQAVKDYMVDMGVNINRIDIKANAFSNPAGSNDTEQGRLLNRRASVVIK